jgi:uncharacterized protein (DUF1015 family)
MAEIHPMNGIRYNTRLVKDLAEVICPPYDIISPQQQGELYQRSPYNFVRVEYGQEMPQDSPSDNRYTRAAAFLDQWLKNEVLTIDGSPSIYIDDHYFTHKGKELKRRGMVVRIRLEEWHRMVVRPHEGTRAGPKSDRVNLIRALKANTSPILSTYEDRDKAIHQVLSRATSDKPLARVRKLEGERHDLWAVTRPDELNRIISALANEPVYIADGHHRYESALVYQREQVAIHPDAPPDAAFNFVMMTLVAFDDPGLLILPPHRLLRGLSQSKLEELKSELPAFFEMEKMPFKGADIWHKLDEWQSAGDNLRLVVFGLDGDNFLLLALRDLEAAARFMPSFHTAIYRKLDVSLVDHIILEEMLGIKPEGDAGIAFNYDREDSVKKVQSGEFQLAFIIKPVRPETIKAISDASDRMPRKSTYFYPKLPSGLVVNRLV